MKRVTTLCVSLLLILSFASLLALPAHAAGASITYLGKASGFDFQPGSEYTATDLFQNFKGVMPGDTLSDTIYIQNKATDSDYIKLYMRAVPHTDAKNPMSDTVAQENHNDLSYMYDFLAQMSMEVYYGSKLIYQASADQLGGLRDSVYLGSIRRSREAKLTVKLLVPLEMDNKYANRVGEVDWMFTAEAFDDPPLIQTGQLNWPIPVLAGTGTVMILLGLWIIFKKRKNEYA